MAVGFEGLRDGYIYSIFWEEVDLSGNGGRLTRREVEVGHLLARGFEQRQIAEALVISRRTAYTHVRHIREKLGGCSRFEAAVRLRCEMGFGCRE